MTQTAAATRNAAAEMADERARASAWFETLRDRICAAFERIEDMQTSGPFADLAPGRFARKETRRAGEGEGDQGGGVMSVLRRAVRLRCASAPSRRSASTSPPSMANWARRRSAA